MRISVRKITFYAIMLALSLALSIAESFIPFSIPGLKIGLANIITLILLCNFGFFPAFAVNIGRVLLTSLILGNFLQMGFFMSFAGSMLSLITMTLAYIFLKRLTMVGVSLIGAFFHILAQFMVALLYFGSWSIFYYFPLTMVFSLASGIAIGIIALLISSMKSFERIKGKPAEEAK